MTESVLTGSYVLVYIDHVLGEALALDADGAILACRYDGNYIKVYRAGDNSAVVVVGVVARKLTSTGNGEKIYVALVAVTLDKFLKKRAKALGGIAGNACVCKKLTLFNVSKKFGRSHSEKILS
jgi:hypothetical protein